MPNKYRKIPPETRFWEKVKKTDACWLWTAALDKKGYGSIGVGNRHVKAHRFSYTIHRGEIPDGMLVCHHCDNPACVNPDHLFLGTADDNNKDRCNKGRGAIGEKSGAAKLSESDVIYIRDELKNHRKGIRSMAREMGVTHTTIRQIVNRVIWKHI